MDNTEWTGLVIAAVVAVLAFGLSRFVVRRIAQRRMNKQAVEAQARVAQQSRQVRRANERKKK
jgi:hypothetical protein